MAVALVLLINLALIFAFSNLFLADYYLSHKKNQLSDSFDAFYSTYSKQDSSLTNSAVAEIEERGIRVMLYGLVEIQAWYMQSSSFYAEMYSTGDWPPELQFAYISDMNSVVWTPESIRPRTRNSLAVSRLVSSLNGRRAAFVESDTMAKDQLMLFGSLDAYTVICMLSPLESVNESAALATRFSLISGGIALFAGIIVSLVMSMWLARPIRQMTAVAGDIARLDFTRRVPLRARAARRSRDEIYALGESVNSMADALERDRQALGAYNAQLLKDIEQRILTEQAQKALVSNISHELKTPLAIISGYAEGLQSGLAEDSAARDEYCAVIIEESRNMTRLLQNLLRLTRLQSGFAAPCFTEADLCAVAEKTVEALNLSARQKGVSLTLERRTDKTAWADTDACEQVIRNFTVNAIRHTPQGGAVRVSVYEARRGFIRLEVFNSGSHVDEKDMPHIWESFYRADSARSRAGGEVGLGLAIVKAHMTAHGGAYGCQNTEDGVIFFAEFPAEER
jgi:signal transduction histidine kinase